MSDRIHGQQAFRFVHWLEIFTQQVAIGFEGLAFSQTHTHNSRCLYSDLFGSPAVAAYFLGHSCLTSFKLGRKGFNPFCSF